MDDEQALAIKNTASSVCRARASGSRRQAINSQLICVTRRWSLQQFAKIREATLETWKSNQAKALTASCAVRRQASEAGSLHALFQYFVNIQ